MSESHTQNIECGTQLSAAGELILTLWESMRTLKYNLKLTFRSQFFNETLLFPFLVFSLLLMPHIGHFDIKPWKRLVDTKK